MVLVPIVIGHFTSSSSVHHAELLFLLILSIVALIYYLKSAWTNPGYLKGFETATAAGDFSKNMQVTGGAKSRPPMTEEDKVAASNKLRNSLGVAQPGDDITIDFDIEDVEDDDDEEPDESIDLEGKCVSSQRNNRNQIVLPESPSNNLPGEKDEDEDDQEDH